MAHSYDHRGDTSIDGVYLGDDQDNVPERIRLDTNGGGTVDVDRSDGFTPNSERQAVGLDIDHDSDASTPDVPIDSVVDHPDELTENGLRDELGIIDRPRY